MRRSTTVARVTAVTVALFVGVMASRSLAGLSPSEAPFEGYVVDVIVRGGLIALALGTLAFSAVTRAPANEPRGMFAPAHRA